MQRRSFKSAFTLVELLVVIGIIALLISILLPALQKARIVAKQAACGSNMHQLDLVVMMYANDFKGSLPPIVVGGLDDGSMTQPDNVHYYTNGSDPVDIWSILETYEGLSPDSLISVCPEVLQDKGVPNPVPYGTYKGRTGAYPNAVFSFAYSEIIGGFQVPKQGFEGYTPSGVGPVYTETPTGYYWFARPFKLGNIRNSSQTAMFVERDTVYQKPTYDWPNNLNTFSDLNWVIDQTTTGHQEFYGLALVHGPKYSNGYNPDGTHCGTAMGNVLCCDGSVQTRGYRQGTPDVLEGPKNGIGWIDHIAADPAYQP
jgi:prepilin-type N-terminal cleavage/methylation domain-containing protein